MNGPDLTPVGPDAYRSALRQLHAEAAEALRPLESAWSTADPETIAVTAEFTCLLLGQVGHDLAALAAPPEDLVEHVRLLDRMCASSAAAYSALARAARGDRAASEEFRTLGQHSIICVAALQELEPL